MDEKKLSNIKLHVGCGDVYLNGWVNTDIRPSLKIDLLYDMGRDILPYSSNSIEVIRSIYSFEHISVTQHNYCLTEWFRVLISGGRLELIVPNIIWMCEAAIAADKSLQTGVDSIDLLSGTDAMTAFKAAMITLFSDDATGEAGNHEWGFSDTYLRELLKQHGFVDIEPWGEQAKTIISLQARKPE